VVKVNHSNLFSIYRQAQMAPSNQKGFHNNQWQFVNNPFQKIQPEILIGKFLNSQLCSISKIHITQHTQHTNITTTKGTAQQHSNAHHTAQQICDVLCCAVLCCVVPWYAVHSTTAQHTTAHHITAHHSKEQQRTAQHSTAQHITTHHNTSQHITTQHSK
jgi:hypothetical protein